MKKYKEAFLSWNRLFFSYNLSACAGLKPFDCDADLSKRTSGLNFSVWGMSSKEELVNYFQMKTHKYDEHAHIITPTLWITAAKFAACRNDVFYTCDFQCFGNTRWLKYTSYLTGNSQQVFLPSLKMILLASSLEQEINIGTWWHFLGFFTPVSSYRTYQMAW